MRESYKDVRFNISRPMHLEIRAVCKQTHRSERAQISYFLECFAEAMRRNQSFRILSELPEADLQQMDPYALHVHLPEQMADYLQQEADEYAISLSKLCRILLRMSLDYHERIDDRNHLMKKEEYVKRVIDQNRVEVST